MGSLERKVEKAGGRGGSVCVYSTCYLAFLPKPSPLKPPPELSCRSPSMQTLFLGTAATQCQEPLWRWRTPLPCARACQPNEHSVKSSVPVSRVTQMNKPRPLNTYPLLTQYPRGKKGHIEAMENKSESTPTGWGAPTAGPCFKREVCLCSLLAPYRETFPQSSWRPRFRDVLWVGYPASLVPWGSQEAG